VVTILLTAFQIAKSLYISAIQVQTLNGFHLDTFVGYKLFNGENCKRCENLHNIEYLKHGQNIHYMYCW